MDTTSSYTQFEPALSTEVKINRVQLLQSSVFSSDMDATGSYSESDLVPRNDTDRRFSQAYGVSPADTCVEECPSEDDRPDSPLDIESVDD